MSRKSSFVTQAVLLALVLVLIALVLGSTIIAQRERSLAGRLHAWPEADAGYEAFLRFPEEGMPPLLTLLTVDDEPGAVYLVATREDQLVGDGTVARRCCCGKGSAGGGTGGPGPAAVSGPARLLPDLARTIMRYPWTIASGSRETGLPDLWTGPVWTRCRLTFRLRATRWGPGA